MAPSSSVLCLIITRGGHLSGKHTKLIESELSGCHEAQKIFRKGQNSRAQSGHFICFHSFFSLVTLSLFYVIPKLEQEVCGKSSSPLHNT